MKTPSFRRHGFLCLTITAGRTFFLRSGLPFFTVAMTISPTQADGNRFRRPLIPFTEMMYRFFAPVLSAQFTVAATGKPSDILNLLPADPPRPKPENPQININYFSNIIIFFMTSIVIKYKGSLVHAIIYNLQSYLLYK